MRELEFIPLFSTALYILLKKAALLLHKIILFKEFVIFLVLLEPVSFTTIGTKLFEELFVIF